jgi:hypothetical protein
MEESKRLVMVTSKKCIEDRVEEQKEDIEKLCSELLNGANLCSINPPYIFQYC